MIAFRMNSLGVGPAYEASHTLTRGHVIVLTHETAAEAPPRTPRLPNERGA